VAYAEFLLRVNDDRATVEDLNRDLASTAEAQDPDAVRTAAVAILDFVDGERDWLREHPPAECFAAAHASANAMLEAYGSAADRFVTWAATGASAGWSRSATRSMPPMRRVTPWPRSAAHWRRRRARPESRGWAADPPRDEPAHRRRSRRIARGPR
jgi:hypothetical protein